MRGTEPPAEAASFHGGRDAPGLQRCPLDSLSDCGFPPPDLKQKILVLVSSLPFPLLQNEN